jgi:hypothetical protein
MTADFPRIYLGGPMFSTAQVEFNLRLASKLREVGFSVYCPNENASINDKTRTDITGERIYSADIQELENSNVFLCQVEEDSGTMWESGYMDCLQRKVDKDRYWGVIGLATDIRLSTPPDPSKPGFDNQCGYINQFVVGGLKLSLGIHSNIDRVIAKLLLEKERRNA